MLGARWSARAVIVSAAAASTLAGAAAVALPMLPSSHTRPTAVVAAGGPSVAGDSGEGVYRADDGVVAPVVGDTATETSPATAAPPITPATRPVSAIKKPAPKPAAPKATAKPKSTAKTVAGVNVVIPSGPLVGKLNGPDIEGYARYEPQSTCDPTDKPGAVALKTLLTGYYKGTSSFGISRACGSDRSEHYEGRAFDWGVNVDNPSQKAAADNFIAQLMATDAYGHKQALARRMGIMYVIWNAQIWSPGPDSTWRPYTGSNPHTDHVHISLSWAGARAETSYWSGTVVPGLPGDDQYSGGGGSSGSGGGGGHQWDGSAGDHWPAATPSTTPSTVPYSGHGHGSHGSGVTTTTSTTAVAPTTSTTALSTPGGSPSG